MAFDPITAAFEAGKILIEKIWPDPAKQAEEIRKLQELQQKGDLAELNAYVQLLAGQIEINKIEAQNPNVFVSGWRPFIGWVCGFAVAYQFVIYPLLFGFLSSFDVVYAIPELDSSQLFSVLMAMLGIGAMRSYDKVKKVDTKIMGKQK